MRSVLRDLTLFLRARYPLVTLLTHEEDRADRALEKLAQQEGLVRYNWRCSVGLAGPNGVLPHTTEAEAALAACAGVQDKALFAFFDLKPHLKDPRVVRRLRDLAQQGPQRGQAAVVVGSSLAVPAELEKEMSVLDIPLPDKDEIDRLLGVLLQSKGLQVEPPLREQFVLGSLGLTEREIKRLYTRILLGGGGFNDADLSALVEEKRQAIRRSRHLEFWDSLEGFADVGGLDSLKRWLERRQVGFSGRARDAGLPQPKGVFLLGVQGCGKSLMAKAIARLWRFPLLRLDVGAVFQTRGAEEEHLRETVRVAESLAPVVLWIDELEKGFSTASGHGAGDAFGYFLTWMQEKQSAVFVVATANDVRLLPPELLRKGRFDEIFFVDLPNIHERLQVLEIHLKRRVPGAQDFDLTQLAEETEKFSGAELEQVVIEALYNTFAEGREVEVEDLLDVARETVPLAVTMDDHLKELRDWARSRARRASADSRRLDFFGEWDATG